MKSLLSGQSGRSLILGSVVSVGIEFLLFGGYAILYAVCLYILVRQNKRCPARKINILLITTLFVIATVVTFLLVAETVTHLNSHIDCKKEQHMWKWKEIYDKERNGTAVMGGGHHDDHGKQWDGSDDSQKGRGIFEPSGRKKDSGPPSGSSNATCIDDTPTTTGLKQANQIFFIIANMLGDGILIYRVFHIWDRSARVTYVPVVASVINNIMGLVSVGVNPSDGNEYVVKEAFYDLYLILNIVLNLFLTGLIAGRVWYIRRQAQLILKEAVKERYNTAIVVCVESGILYPLFLIIFLSLELSISSLDFFPILVQAVGIAPTLITFRSSLGLSMDSVDQVVQSRLSNVPPGADIRRGWGSARSAVVAEGGYSQGFFGYPSVQRGSGMGASGGRESSLRNDERNSVR